MVSATKRADDIHRTEVVSTQRFRIRLSCTGLCNKTLLAEEKVCDRKCTHQMRTIIVNGTARTCQYSLPLPAILLALLSSLSSSGSFDSVVAVFQVGERKRNICRLLKRFINAIIPFFFPLALLAPLTIRQFSTVVIRGCRWIIASRETSIRQFLFMYL